MRASACSLLGLPLLALLLALSASPASGRLLKESVVPDVPLLFKVLKDWLPAMGTPVPFSSSGSSASRTLIAQVDAPGAATRNVSYEDSGILPTRYPSTDCDPECTGDLICVYRKKAGKKLCRCPKGTTLESPDSDNCLSPGEVGDDTPDTPEPKAAATTNAVQTGGDDGEPCNTQCDMNRKLLKLVNAFRAENGKPPLCLNNKLIQAAKIHSVDTSQNNIFSHTGSDGSLYYTQNGIPGRDDRAGFVLGDCPAHKDCDAENFGRGLVNEEVAFNMWKESPGHRANLLCNAKFVGAYAVDNYYTQDFGSNPDYKCNN